jgi:hypothetical protein
MRTERTPFMLNDAEPPRVELRLAAADGTHWTVTMSAGMERFVGAYPRLGAMVAAGPLLHFRPAYPSA